MRHLPKSVYPLLAVLIIVLMVWFFLSDSKQTSNLLLEMSPEKITEVVFKNDKATTVIQRSGDDYTLNGTVCDRADWYVVNELFRAICKVEIVDEIDLIANKDYGFTLQNTPTLIVSEADRQIVIKIGKYNPVSELYFLSIRDRDRVLLVNSRLPALLKPLPFSLRQRFLFCNTVEFAETIKVKFPNYIKSYRFEKDNEGQWWLTNYDGTDDFWGDVITSRRDYYFDRCRKRNGIVEYAVDSVFMNNFLYIANNTKVKRSSTNPVEIPINGGIIEIANRHETCSVVFEVPQEERVDCWRNSNKYSLQVSKELYDYSFDGLASWLSTGLTGLPVSSADSIRVEMSGRLPLIGKQSLGKWQVPITLGNAKGLDLSDKFSDLALELQRMDLFSVLPPQEKPLSTRHRVDIDIWMPGNEVPLKIKFGRNHDDSKLLAWIPETGVVGEVDPQIITTVRLLYTSAGLWD